jgi:hypothetical protein
MMKACLIRALLFLGSLHGISAAFNVQDPSTDFAFLEFEPYPSFGGNRFSGPAVAEAGDKRLWRLAGQLSFPAGKIGENHQLFGSFKSTLMDRDIVYRDSLLLNDGMLKRFWLSGGDSWSGADGQSSMALVGVGVNSDFADLGMKDFNTEWIYAHFWTVSPSFNWGLGLDVQQYFDKYEPYPLIFAEWRATDRMKLKWDADFLEMRRFLSPWLCFTAGIRFNLEFFALKQDADYEYNTMGLETGFQYAVGGNCYVRIKYKELVWGRQTLGLPDGTHHTEGIDAGRSLRLNFAYGL